MKKLCLILFFITSINAIACGQEKLHHLVLFKLKPGVQKSDSRYPDAVKLLRGLVGQIPQVLDMRAGENFSTRTIAVDFGLMVVLENETALQAYLDHPAHKAVVQAWKEIAEWTIADFWSTVQTQKSRDKELRE